MNGNVGFTWRINLVYSEKERFFYENVEFQGFTLTDWAWVEDMCEWLKSLCIPASPHSTGSGTNDNLKTELKRGKTGRR